MFGLAQGPPGLAVVAGGPQGSVGLRSDGPPQAASNATETLRGHDHTHAIPLQGKNRIPRRVSKARASSSEPEKAGHKAAFVVSTQPAVPFCVTLRAME